MILDSNAYKILGIIQSYAPNGKAQEMCAKLYRDYKAESDKDLVRYMTAMLYDGLAFGNWPWIVR